MCVALREEGPSVEVSPSHTSSLGCAHLIARILRAAHQSRGPASGSTQGRHIPNGIRHGSRLQHAAARRAGSHIPDGT